MKDAVQLRKANRLHYEDVRDKGDRFESTLATLGRGQMKRPKSNEVKIFGSTAETRHRMILE